MELLYPHFLSSGGDLQQRQSVGIAYATPGVTIYCTTNGTAPATTSTKYIGAISVKATETIEVIAVLTGYTNSAVAGGAHRLVDN